MTLTETIHQYADQLPQAFQQELLDFVQFLVMKARQQEKQNWTSFSLASAIRDIQDEDLYSISDLRVPFK